MQGPIATATAAQPNACPHRERQRCCCCCVGDGNRRAVMAAEIAARKHCCAGLKLVNGVEDDDVAMMPDAMRRLSIDGNWAAAQLDGFAALGSVANRCLPLHTKR